MAGSFIGTFIRPQIWGVVRGERELEEDVVDDVLGALCGLCAREQGGEGERILGTWFVVLI